jgi:hypothetical protein
LGISLFINDFNLLQIKTKKIKQHIQLEKMVITRSKAKAGSIQPPLPGSPMRTARKISKKNQSRTTKKKKIIVSPRKFFQYREERLARDTSMAEGNSHLESQLSVTPQRELLHFTNPFESDTSLDTSQCPSSPEFKEPARLIPRRLTVVIPRISTPRPGTPIPSPEKPATAPRLPAPRPMTSAVNNTNPAMVIIKREPEDYY